jgi:Fic family protein
MKYKLLSSLYYQDRDLYAEEYKKRMNSSGTVMLPIPIHDNPAFVVADWEIANLIESIGTNSAEAQRVLTMLPAVAQRYYLRQCLIEEIQMTNEIEGVQSTRKEIRVAMDADEGTAKQERFKGIAKKYALLFPDEKQQILLNSCADIRSLYDDIVSKEVVDHEQPDGEIFRRNKVFVMSKTQQVRHEGVMPEAKIIAYMEQALRLLDNPNISALVRIAIFHYYFGYIHPFYDGNGRVSRFISSMLLNKNHFPLLAFDLAHTVKNNRNKYYDAFRNSNNPLNKGDITPFVIVFLEFLHKSSVRMRKQLSEGVQRLGRFQENITKNLFLEDSQRQRKSDVLFILVQNALFGMESLLAAELQEALGCSRSSMDNTVNQLIQQGYPIVKSKDGWYNRYSIDIDALEQMIDTQE